MSGDLLTVTGLTRHFPVTRGANLAVKVGGAMWLEPEKVEDPAGVWVPGNVIGRGDHGRDGEVPVGVTTDATAKIPLR